MGQRGLGDTTMLAHPVAETLNQRGNALRFDDDRGYDAYRSQMLDKAPCCGGVVGVATLESVRTHASVIG